MEIDFVVAFNLSTCLIDDEGVFTEGDGSLHVKREPPPQMLACDKSMCI